MIHVTRRVIRFWGWLLTPLVAGAASLLGAWVGAAAGRTVASPKLGFAVLVVGAAVAGFTATFLWASALRRAARYSDRRGPAGTTGRSTSPTGGA